jgi:hypothetical protein
MKRTRQRVPATIDEGVGASARDAATRATQLHEETTLLQLAVDDVPRIAKLDYESWPEPLRVSEANVARRFELGHLMLGIEHGSTLLGVVAFSYAPWSPQPNGAFPTTNAQFNSQQHSKQHNAAFAYNLVVRPCLRGSSISRRLIAAGLAQVRRDGCDHLLGHARCPSYNGSDVAKIEHFSANTIFRRAIDDAVRSDTVPALEILLLDPVLRFYYRALRCTFVRAMPGFLPEDEASGGMAVRFVKRLQPAGDGQYE